MIIMSVLGCAAHAQWTRFVDIFYYFTYCSPAGWQHILAAHLSAFSPISHSTLWISHDTHAGLKL